MLTGVILGERLLKGPDPLSLCDRRSLADLARGADAPRLQGQRPRHGRPVGRRRREQQSRAPLGQHRRQHGPRREENHSLVLSGYQYRLSPRRRRQLLLGSTGGRDVKRPIQVFPASRASSKK